MKKNGSPSEIHRLIIPLSRRSHREKLYHGTTSSEQKGVMVEAKRALEECARAKNGGADKKELDSLLGQQVEGIEFSYHSVSAASCSLFDDRHGPLQAMSRDQLKSVFYNGDPSGMVAFLLCRTSHLLYKLQCSVPKYYIRFNVEPPSTIPGGKCVIMHNEPPDMFLEFKDKVKMRYDWSTRNLHICKPPSTGDPQGSPLLWTGNISQSAASGNATGKNSPQVFPAVFRPYTAAANKLTINFHEQQGRTLRESIESRATSASTRSAELTGVKARYYESMPQMFTIRL